MVNCSGVEWVNKSELPRIAIVYVPVWIADATADIVKVEELPAAPGVTLTGENAQLIFPGMPEQERETEFWNGPPKDARFTVRELALPSTTFSEGTEVAIEKSVPAPVSATE
jgi:hypothetical protein